MATMKSLLKSVSVDQINSLPLNGDVLSTTRSAEKIARVVRILNDTCSDPTRYCRIVRSQLGREEHALFTYNQIDRRALDGDLDAVDVIKEFVKQEREDGVPSEISDSQIIELWKEGVSVGRILSANPYKLANYFDGRGKEGAKPYVSLTHWAKALRAVSEEGVAPCSELEAMLYEAMVAFHEKFFTGDLEEDFELVCPGFINAYTGEEVAA